MSRKGGTGGGGWVYHRVQTAWTWLKKALGSTEWAVSLLVCMNGLISTCRASISNSEDFSQFGQVVIDLECQIL